MAPFRNSIATAAEALGHYAHQPLLQCVTPNGVWLVGVHVSASTPPKQGQLFVASERFNDVAHNVKEERERQAKWERGDDSSCRAGGARTLVDAGSIAAKNGGHSSGCLGFPTPRLRPISSTASERQPVLYAASLGPQNGGDCYEIAGNQPHLMIC
ncbi:hypothetical protein MRX96_029443 [Rhipicephalus microplus]